MDLLNKNQNSKVTEKTNPNYNNKFMRYKKVLDTPKSNEEEDSHFADIKKLSSQLINRTITPEQYKIVLKEKGINPNIEGINKVIRDHEDGKSIKYNELVRAVIKYKDETFDPTKVTFEIKNKKFFKHTLKEDNGTKSMIPSKNGTGQLFYSEQKKAVHSKYNSYYSNKEVFDWDLSTLNKLKGGELNSPGKKDTPKAKFFYDTHITFGQSKESNFSALNGNFTPKTNKSITISNLGGSGDIFTWKGCSSTETKTQQKYIPRKNPNALSGEERCDRKVQPNKMLFSSEDNTLSGKRYY